MKSQTIAFVTGTKRVQYIVDTINNQYGLHGVSIIAKQSPYSAGGNDAIADYEIFALCAASQIAMLKAFIVGFIAGQDWQQYHADNAGWFKGGKENETKID